jgi:hypothetical protein
MLAGRNVGLALGTATAMATQKAFHFAAPSDRAGKNTHTSGCIV